MNSEATLREKAIGAGLALAVGLIPVLPLLALPGASLADTIHLEASPTNPPRGGNMTVTASGSTSSATDEIRVASPASGGPCPKEYPGFAIELEWVRPLSAGLYASTPTYNTT